MKAVAVTRLPFSAQVQAILRKHKAALICVGLALALTPTARPAAAQHQSYNLPPKVAVAQVSDLEQKRRLIFTYMQAKPNDLQAAFAYATLSAQLGDLEAAASTYEAMLIRQPRAGRVRLELAATYYRLGAYQSAQQNFDYVRKSPDTPKQVRDRIDEYLTAITARSQGKSGFSGRITLGFRQQSNANAGIAGDTVRLNGINDWVLDDEAKAKGDGSGLATFQLQHRLPWGTQGHAFESSLTLGLTEFNTLHSLSNRSLELSFGPDFALNSLGWEGAKLGLSASFGQNRLGDAEYLTTKGLGLSLRAPITPISQFAFTLNWRRDDYAQNATYTRGNIYDGHRIKMALNYSTQLRDDWQLFAALSHEQRSTSIEIHSYQEDSLQLGLLHRFAPLWGKGQRPWSFGVTAHATRRVNEAINPVLDAQKPQHSREFGLQAMQTIPLRENLSLQLFAGYRGISSNHVTRDFDDRFGGFSVSHRF